jgi:MerR family transcriptional regulator, redox-sensitive transcriptional activator SoxR
LLTIGELARLAGRRASSIRYYEQVGLLPQPPRVSGQRRYGPDYLQLLTIITAAQRAGLSLEQIKSMLRPSATDSVGALRHAATARLPLLAAEIDRAEQARRWLEHAASCECPSLPACPLFEPDGNCPSGDGHQG